MNPLELTVSELVLWGVVAHVIGDWLLQNAWIAAHKSERRARWGSRGDARRLTDEEVEAQTGDVRITVYGNTYGSLPTRWWDRHPAAFVHAAIHALVMAPIFGWVSLPLAVVHLVVDTRTPVAWWSRRMRQTQPRGDYFISSDAVDPCAPYEWNFDEPTTFKTRWELPAAGEPTPPEMIATYLRQADEKHDELVARMLRRVQPAFDIGLLVRMANDQAFHVVTIAAAALLIGALS